jgi:hypothetical protein
MFRMQASNRRPCPLTLESIESRLVPSFTFSSGVLIVHADTSTSSDYVTISSTGSAGDGSTGVKVRSNLVNNGAATTIGGPGNPVLRITLDMQDGNDTVLIAGLAQTRIRVGEGNGNNVVAIGDAQDIGVAVGNGRNAVLVGGGSANTAGGIAPGNTIAPAGTVVLVGWSYTIDNTTGGLFTPFTPIGNNHASSAVIVRNHTGQKAVVDVATDGSSVVATDDGDDIVWVQGNGNSLISGDKGNNQIQVDGNGNNRIDARGIGSITVNGQGNNRIDAGNNANNAVYLSFTGPGGNNKVWASTGATVKINGLSVTSSGGFNGTNTVVRFGSDDDC